MIGKSNATIIVGGAPVTTGYQVQWIDIDGSILKREFVVSGGTATPPTITPNYDPTYLVFNTWNYTDFTNIQAPTNIGAIYNTVDNKSYVKVTLDATSGLALTLYFTKSNADTMTVDWGDSTSNTYTNTGAFNTGAHTYPANGNYVISIWITGTGTFGYGNGGSTTGLLGSVAAQRDTATSVYDSAQVGTTVNSGLVSLRKLLVISLNQTNTIQSLPSTYLSGAILLSCINIPSTITYTNASCFNNTNSVLYYNTSNTFTAYFGQSLAGAGAETFIITSAVNILQTWLFNSTRGFHLYIIQPTTPPTLGTDIFLSTSPYSKIYVPDAQLNTYKTAAGWSVYASRIYPISYLNGKVLNRELL